MLKGIQVARGVAALFVVLYHASRWSHVFYHQVFNKFFNFGYIGVDFFFVLSGFIIFHVHSSDSPGIKTWKRYFLKRLIRIYPPYLPISITLLLAYFYFPEIVKGNREIGIITSIFLVPSKYWPSLEVAWTLIHEMLFYSIFSLYFFSRKVFLVVTFFWVSLIIVNIFIGAKYYLLAFLFNFHNIEFIFGVIIAYIINFYSKYYKISLVFGFLLIFFYALGAYYQLNNLFLGHSEISILYLGLAFSLIVYGLYGIDKYTSVSYPISLIVLGSASYSLYLIHYPLVCILNRISSMIYPEITPYYNIIFITTVLLCIIISILYHRIYEVKVISYLRNKLGLGSSSSLYTNPG